MALAATPLHANTASALPKRSVLASRYELTKEVTLQGTVQSVDARPNSSLGAHLTVATSQGEVEAEIGPFLLDRPGAPSFTPGEQVKLIGITATVNNHKVLITRLVVAGRQTITVRNLNGFAVPPAGYVRPSSTSVNGGAR